VFGAETIDLSAVEQIVEVNQLRAIGAALTYIQQHYLDGRYSLKTILEYVMADLQSSSPDILTAFPQGDLAMFRPEELAAVLNRMRSLSVEKGDR
jgi:hypothetical protein